MRAVYNTPREAFTVALPLTNCLEVAKFLPKRSSKRLFYVYVCPPFLVCPKSRIGMGRHRKVMNLFEIQGNFFSENHLVFINGITPPYNIVQEKFVKTAERFINFVFLHKQRISSKNNQIR